MLSFVQLRLTWAPTVGGAIADSTVRGLTRSAMSLDDTVGRLIEGGQHSVMDVLIEVVSNHHLRRDHLRLI